jgi:hypothetical protein
MRLRIVLVSRVPWVSVAIAVIACVLVASSCEVALFFAPLGQPRVRFSVVPELEAVDRLEAVILVMRGTNVDETEPTWGKDVGLYLVNTWDTKCDHQSYRAIGYLA